MQPEKQQRNLGEQLCKYLEQVDFPNICIEFKKMKRTAAICVISSNA